MPWESERQRRWGNSPAGIAAMGQAKVDEFNRASKGMRLPASKRYDKPKNVIKQKTKYANAAYVVAANVR